MLDAVAVADAAPLTIFPAGFVAVVVWGNDGTVSVGVVDVGPVICIVATVGICGVVILSEPIVDIGISVDGGVGVNLTCDASFATNDDVVKLLFIDDIEAVCAATSAADWDADCIDIDVVSVS